MKLGFANIRQLAASALILGCLNAVSEAQSTFAFQGLYAGNGGAFTSIDGNGSANTSATPFVANHSFTGLNSHGVSQTMTIGGSAWSNATPGKIHISGQGTISNPYFNSSNSPYFNGTLDSNGSPDLLAINGNAGFTDILTYTGLNGTGYKVNFYFRLEGSTSGDTLAGLNFSTSDPQGQSYNPRTTLGNELWITPFYAMDFNQPLTINADFFAGFNTQVSAHQEGLTYSGSAQYGNTLELAGMTVYDSTGAEVTGYSVSSASGTSYSTGAVPEPATVLTCVLGVAGLLRKRRRS